DLTVVKRAERAGTTFAYIGGGTQYHTLLDDFAHIDAGSVQRRGDQALAMVRAFAAADLGAVAPGDAVWFDVFAAFVVWWPAGWTLWIVAAALALLAIAVGRGLRAGRPPLRGVAVAAPSSIGPVCVAPMPGG